MEKKIPIIGLMCGLLVLFSFLPTAKGFIIPKENNENIGGIMTDAGNVHNLEGLSNIIVGLQDAIQPSAQSVPSNIHEILPFLGDILTKFSGGLPSVDQLDYFHFFSAYFQAIPKIAYDVLFNYGLLDLYDILALEQQEAMVLLEKTRQSLGALTGMFADPGDKLIGTVDLAFTYTIKEKSTGSVQAIIICEYDYENGKWETTDFTNPGFATTNLCQLFQTLFQSLPNLDLQDEPEQTLMNLGEIKNAVDLFNNLSLDQLGYTGEMSVAFIDYKVYEEKVESEESVDLGETVESEEARTSRELKFSCFLERINDETHLTINFPRFYWKQEMGLTPRFLASKGVDEATISPSFVLKGEELLIKLNVDFEYFFLPIVFTEVMEARIIKDDGGNFIFRLNAVPYFPSTGDNYQEDINDYIAISIGNLRFIPGQDDPFSPPDYSKDCYGFDYKIVIYNALVGPDDQIIIEGEDYVPVSK